eukprot:364236-Chlamydomonas_euryale.AAC.2
MPTGGVVAVAAIVDVVLLNEHVLLPSKKMLAGGVPLARARCDARHIDCLCGRALGCGHAGLLAPRRHDQGGASEGERAAQRQKQRRPAQVGRAALRDHHVLALIPAPATKAPFLTCRFKSPLWLSWACRWAASAWSCPAAGPAKLNWHCTLGTWDSGVMWLQANVARP